MRLFNQLSYLVTSKAGAWTKDILYSKFLDLILNKLKNSVNTISQNNIEVIVKTIFYFLNKFLAFECHLIIIKKSPNFEFKIY